MEERRNRNYDPINELQGEASDNLIYKLDAAVASGVDEEIIEYVLDQLSDAAKGRRFCLVLSLNEKKAWAGRTPLLRVDHQFD